MTVYELWLGVRNRLLSDPRFQKWAIRFPLTRRIARARSREVFDLVGGFVYSQVLLSAVRLKLFDHLAKEPLTVPELAPRLGLQEPAARRLIAAAAALDLAEKVSGDRYALGRHGAALRANPWLNAMIEHHAMFYEDLTDPVGLLRGECETTRLARFWSYTADPHDAAKRVTGYSMLMKESHAIIATEVLDSFRFNGFRRLLDVGGGEGSFVVAVSQRVPDLQLGMFDLPAVAQRAKTRIDSLGLADRIGVHSGSFLSDELPVGSDIITLVRVLHDHDDDVAQDLLRRIYRALPDGGALLIAEPMSGVAGAERAADAYFGFYFAAMGRGRTRTPEELTSRLRAAGFTYVNEVQTRNPLFTSLMFARR